MNNQLLWNKKHELIERQTKNAASFFVFSLPFLFGFGSKSAYVSFFFAFGLSLLLKLVLLLWVSRQRKLRMLLIDNDTVVLTFKDLLSVPFIIGLGGALSLLIFWASWGQARNGLIQGGLFLCLSLLVGAVDMMQTAARTLRF